MFKIGQNKAQAAVELAVFGAILIFLLGTIIRTAVGNSYEQDENFKAMRMAMLESWTGSQHSNTAHNTSQVLIIEDRLSPDSSKYGDLDRNPMITMGGGTFSYEMFYPVDDNEEGTNQPIMDIYINGQHFPFAEGAFVTKTLTPPTSCPMGSSGPFGPPPVTAAQCYQNQCLRQQKEWVGGIVTENEFQTPTVSDPTVITGSCGPVVNNTPTAAQRACQQTNNACEIFTDLSKAGVISGVATSPTIEFCSSNETGSVSLTTILPANEADLSTDTSHSWANFIQYYKNSQYFSGYAAGNAKIYLQKILDILRADNYKYPLFYTMVANPGDKGGNDFSPVPPTCTAPSCVNQALTQNLQTFDYTNNFGYWNSGVHSGDMMYDLMRNKVYAPSGGALDALAVESPSQFGPTVSDCSGNGVTSLRCFIAWQWAATAGTSADSIGLNTDNKQFPSYDVDGRLQEVIIHGLSYDQTGSAVTVTYEDPSAGDIDAAWGSTSCGPKPGLGKNSQIFTFTKNGTYLEIREGKLYNPESIGAPGAGTVVRSVNKRDSIDLIQRSIQLSNNTGRFCTKGPTPMLCSGPSCAVPNPVEACVDGNTCNCFVGDNDPLTSACGATLKKTCYDTGQNIIFVRSRLEDRRGNFWITNATGKLKVQK
jgi:hypothetical protein